MLGSIADQVGKVIIRQPETKLIQRQLGDTQQNETPVAAVITQLEANPTIGSGMTSGNRSWIEQKRKRRPMASLWFLHEFSNRVQKGYAANSSDANTFGGNQHMDGAEAICGTNVASDRSSTQAGNYLM